MQSIIKTNYKEFDTFIGGGFTPNTVHLFEGRVNIGKSIILQNFAYNSYSNGDNVLILSLEDKEEKITNNLNKLSQNNLKPKKKINKLLFYNDYSLLCTINKIKEIIEIIENDKQIKINLLIIDSFDLILSDNIDKISLKEHRIEVLKGLEILAKELNISILTSASINKSLKSKNEVIELNDNDFIYPHYWKIEKNTDGDYELINENNKIFKVNINKDTFKIENIHLT